MWKMQHKAGSKEVSLIKVGTQSGGGVGWRKGVVLENSRSQRNRRHAEGTKNNG